MGLFSKTKTVDIFMKKFLTIIYEIVYNIDKKSVVDF